MGEKHLKQFSFYEELNEILLKMYIGLHVQYPLFLSDFNETLIFSTGFRKKYSEIKFIGNPSSGSQVVPWERTDGQMDMKKIIVAFRNSANLSKNWLYHRL
jgi:hypothetical protein